MTTMRDLFERFKLERLPKLARTTRRDYLGHLKYLDAHFGDWEAGTIKAKDVGRFLQMPGAKMNLNKRIAVLSAVMTDAVGRWYIDGCEANPCLKVVRHESHPRTRYVTDAEFWAVHSIAPFSVQIAMEMALLTGQRQSDITQLKWTEVHETHIDITQGKTGKHLGIRITPALEEVLLRARRRAPMFPRLYVIRTMHGQPYTPEGFRAMWQLTVVNAAKNGAMKEKWTFHDIRAKCASDKTNLQDASALLGHSDVGLTRRIYKRSIQMVEPLR